MAKLNVDVLDMADGEVTKIEYEGEEYVKSEEKAEVGDVLYNIEPHGIQSANTYYKVGKVDEYARVYDDNEDLHGWMHSEQGNNFEVFKKVVNPANNVGKYIVFTDVEGIDVLTEGKSYEITSVKGSSFYVIAGDEGSKLIVFTNESESGYSYIIEDSPREIAQADNGLQVGDYVVANPSADREYSCTTTENMRIGKVLEVGEEIIKLEIVSGEDRVGNFYWVDAEHFRKISEQEAELILAEAKFPVGTKVRITVPEGENTEFGRVYVKNDEIGTVEEVKIRESDGKVIVNNNFPSYGSYWTGLPSELEVVSEEELTESPNTTFEIGDLAVIADDAYAGSLEHGDVVEVIGSGEFYDYKAKRLVDGETEFYDTDELIPYEPTNKELQVGDKVVLAIPKGEKPKLGFGGVSNGDIGEVISIPAVFGDIEINFDANDDWEGYSDEVILVEKAPTLAPPAPKFNVGDYAKVVGATRFRGISEGTFVKISSELDEDGEYEVYLIDKSNYDYAEPEDLVKPTEKEIEELEKEEKWAKIGRKPYEYKEGDLVRVTEDNARLSRNMEGDIGYISEVGSFGDWIKVEVDAREGSTGNYHKADSIELVTPVEQRFDKVAGE